MKRNDIKALHSKTSVELKQELTKKKQAALKIQLEAHLKKDKNNRRLKVLKDDIARIATVLNQAYEREKQIKK